ncbi:MAG: TSUP family transporter [Christensenellales bacterium]
MIYVLAGIIGGILGGMGMGGGTLLVPVLTIFLDVGQKTAQLINLVAFIPMSIVCLLLHFKNKLVELKRVLFVLIPAIGMAIASSFWATGLDGELLKKAFGYFLIALSVIGIAGKAVQYFKKKKKS